MIIEGVLIEVVAPKRMRYRTVGDWFFIRSSTISSCLVIQVADTGSWISNMLVAVHELIEAFLCQVFGVSAKAVDRFDLAHQDDEDPGTHPKAPYQAQHLAAMGIEMVLAQAAGIKWRPYEELLDKIYSKIPKRKKLIAGTS